MRKKILLAATLGLLAVLARSGPFATLAQPQDRPERSQEPIRVVAETVYLNVLVADRKGDPIRGLKKEDFRVYEDGVEQQIENFFPVEAPFSVALTLDTSWSTYAKLAIIQNSAIDFVKQLHPDDEVMVISFDDEVRLETDFTRDRDGAARAIKQTRTGESTQLYEAVYLTLEELRKRPDRKVMVLFTDGVDTRSPTTSAHETTEFAKESDITLYPIFFDTEREAVRQLYQGGIPIGGPAGTPGTIPGRNPGPVAGPTTGPLPVPMPVPAGGIGDIREREHEIRMQYMRAKAYLSELAKITGGKRFDVRGDLTDLKVAFNLIAEDLRSLYTIGYISGNQKEDGKFRKLKLVVSRDGARVRHREGYYPLKRQKR